MNYSVFTVPPFDKQLKRLAKKYPSLKNEYGDLIKSLEEEPEQGTPLGNNCFKIRIAIASKNKGKSGGARVITNVLIEETAVYLGLAPKLSDHFQTAKIAHYHYFIDRVGTQGL